MDQRETAHSGGNSWIRRVVVAADGSPASNQGLEQVADLAHRLGAKVLVVFVRHIPATAMLGNGAAQPSILEALDEQEADVRQAVTRIIGGTGAAWEFEALSGSPGEEIVKVVEANGADLLVVGSNRHNSIHNLLLGSTAAYLATHSPAPVLVMRSNVSSLPASPKEAPGAGQQGPEALPREVKGS
ncbi:MAG TPA: universal stress protein [Candidatus Acidoferrum sp.]|jgi:nucleotide-binding universal stress UspA family protein|nr:universal stress protein [Candidatus Acidoferrum sp.]